MTKINYSPHDDCGVFGIISKNSNKISSDLVVKATECIRYRGSKYGAGYAAFSLDGNNQIYKIKAFVEDDDTVDLIRNQLLSISEIKSQNVTKLASMNNWNAEIHCSDNLKFTDTINKINAELVQDSNYKGRIYSFGNFVDVYKDIGYPIDVARSTGLLANPVEADMWISHTRQPTNSPGLFPIWSHPFNSNNSAIVHNGDISSFGANIEFLHSRGIDSLVGTDSEVVAYIIDYLTRVENLSMSDVGTILSNPYENFLDDWGIVKSDYISNLFTKYKGSQLDGPFTIIAGNATSNDLQMLCLVDRSKLRPAVIGEDDNYIFMASEECQIRLLSPSADIWTPSPGRFVLASKRDGLIESGRNNLIFSSDHSNYVKEFSKLDSSKDVVLDGKLFNTFELNSVILNNIKQGNDSITVKNVSGHRYIGVGITQKASVNIHGTPGNCMANFNKGGQITVFGSAQDNVADAMYEGEIIIHGDARDVLGQALQGGRIFVRGNVGNRALIQMREYRDKKPVVIIGGRADDYFGEYMSGGLGIVLGIAKEEQKISSQLVGNFVATGMLRGKIYIRGKVNQNSIALSPSKEDVMNYLNFLLVEKIISENDISKIQNIEHINLEILEQTLPENAFSKVKKLFANKYSANLIVEYRTLNDNDKLNISSHIEDFCNVFNISKETLDSILSSEFTIIATPDSVDSETAVISSEE